MTTLFNADNNVQTPTAQTPAEGETYLDKLVGPGKKFATVEDLAKGKYESDEVFVPQITRENKELRDTVSKQATMQELLDQLDTRARQNPVTTPGQDEGTRETPATPAASKQELMEMVRQIANEERTQATEQQNLNTAVQSLQKVWGNSWQQKLVSKQQELGLSQEFMDSIALKSPAALLKLVGADVPVQMGNPNAHVAPQTRVAIAPDDLRSPVKNEAYWENMYKKDPALYTSPAMVLERHKSAIKLGRAYFDNN